MKRPDLLFIFRKLRFLVALTKLFPNDLHLFTQIVIFLVLIHGCAGLFLNFRLQSKHLNFLAKQSDRHFQPFCGIQLAKHFCLFRKIYSGILSNGVRQETVVFACQHFQLHSLGRMLGGFAVHPIQAVCFSAKRSGMEVVRAVGTGDGFHNTA